MAARVSVTSKFLWVLARNRLTVTLVFGLPRRLWIEMNTLEQKFLQLSWKLHPDNFVNAPEQERELSLKRSSELNDAYRTLRDLVARVEYLLEIEGARKEGELMLYSSLTPEDQLRLAADFKRRYGVTPRQARDGAGRI